MKILSLYKLFISHYCVSVGVSVALGETAAMLNIYQLRLILMQVTSTCSETSRKDPLVVMVQETTVTAETSILLISIPL